MSADRRGCNGGPHDSGHYNSSVWDAQFFRSEGGSWESEYGDFFLSWYSGMLEQHANAVLTAAAAALRGTNTPRRARRTESVMQKLTRMAQGSKGSDQGALHSPADQRALLDAEYQLAPACHLGVKLAGVHWWHKSRSHAAELTAGYYNTRHRNGYDPLLKVCNSSAHGQRTQERKPSKSRRSEVCYCSFVC